MTDRGVVVLSLSPALDRTVRVEVLRVGEVHRPTWTDERAGGKGANVARTLHRHGAPVALVAPLGGVQGDAVRVLARREGLRLVDVAVPAATRVCTTVLDLQGATSLYEQAAELRQQDWLALLDAVQGLLPARAIVLTGALPPGLPPRALGELAATARAEGTPLWADVGGLSLREAAGLGAVVWPNLFEARHALGLAEGGHELVDGQGGTSVEGAATARVLVELGAAAAVVSCGRDGAVLATPHEATLHLSAPMTAVRNPVGAGDVLLGATLAVLDEDGPGQPSLEHALAHGVRLASLSCATDAATDLPSGVAARWERT